MLVRVLIAILIVIGCLYIGFSISQYYKLRELFFCDLVDFANHAKTQISFFQNPLQDIFESFDCKSDLGKIIKQKSKILKGVDGASAKKPLYIKDNEWQWINGFFDRLGKCDVEREVDGLLGMLEKATDAKIKAQIEYTKNGPSATKLGLVFGLALAIIVF